MYITNHSLTVILKREIINYKKEHKELIYCSKIQFHKSGSAPN